MRTDRYDNRDRTQHITTVNNISVKIDYDKLAEAIVRAEEKAKNTIPNAVQKKRRFWHTIWSILKGEKSDDGRYLSAPFSLLCSILFRIIAIAGFLFAVLLIIVGVKTFPAFNWNGWSIADNIIFCCFLIISFVTVILLSFLMLGAANDIEHEKDKHYIIAVFSGVISIAALIVAILAH